MGLIVGWALDTANIYDGSAFQVLVEHVTDEMVVFSDTGFEKADWYLIHLKACHHGEWTTRCWLRRATSKKSLIAFGLTSNAMSLTPGRCSIFSFSGMDLSWMTTALSSFLCL